MLTDLNYQEAGTPSCKRPSALKTISVVNLWRQKCRCVSHTRRQSNGQPASPSRGTGGRERNEIGIRPASKRTIMSFDELQEWSHSKREIEIEIERNRVGGGSSRLAACRAGGCCRRCLTWQMSFRWPTRKAVSSAESRSDRGDSFAIHESYRSDEYLDPGKRRRRATERAKANSYGVIYCKHLLKSKQKLIDGASASHVSRFKGIRSETRSFDSVASLRTPPLPLTNIRFRSLERGGTLPQRRITTNRPSGP